jgi:hypothetical protein
MERERLLERLRVRLEALERLEPRAPGDLLRASVILQAAERELGGYAARARRYELLDPLARLELSERALYATYAAAQLNGGGEEVIERARKDLEEARNALRSLLSLL